MHPAFAEHGFRGGVGHGFLGVLVVVIVPTIIVGLVIYAAMATWTRRTPSLAGLPPAPPQPFLPPAGPSPIAQHILDERFARGEIDADAYVRNSDLLRATRERAMAMATGSVTTAAAPAPPADPPPAPPTREEPAVVVDDDQG